MDENFWHKRWENNKIGFHQGEANVMMVDNFHALSLAKDSRVFVPLCGKTRDIAWLLSEGYRVVGVELSELAVRQLFSDLGVEPRVSTAGKLQHFKASNIDIYVGDIFNMSAKFIGTVDATYDRAALIALPADLREKYASHVSRITNTAPQLLICLDYEQTVMQGPPFSIDKDELIRVYGDQYNLTKRASVAVDGGLKGKWPAQEIVWLLH
ncbi:MAG: thiopurine S-methyltransferase [Paracoccaceae bacterium]|jgi:thiopurine S-methyltransferase